MIADGEEMPGDMLAVRTNTVEEEWLLDGGPDGAVGGDESGSAGAADDGGPLCFDALASYLSGVDEWADENMEDVLREGDDGMGGSGGV